MADKQPEFPVRQLQILLACRLVEPLAINSVVPYLFAAVKFAAPQLSDLDATKQVTLLFSAYSLAQFATNIVWGRLSDRVGRRPVMLFGLAGVLASTLGFAFSTTLPALFVCRIAAGLLSGNVVITRTMIGDMVRGRENKAKAFAWNQTAYQIGTVIGPMVGGYLVQPCTQIPALCRGGRFAWLQTYPFALPNLLIALMVAVSMAVAYACMDETLVRTPPPRPGEERPLLEDAAEEAVQKMAVPTAASILLQPDLLHVVLCYAFMALHSICFDQIFPVFLATGPASSRPPLQLNGGLDYSAATVATFVSAGGLVFIALMLTVFAPVDTRFGTLVCLRASLLAYPVAYALLPYLILLPDAPAWIRHAGVALVLGVKTLAAVFSFNDTAILLNVVAPSPAALGLVNGVAQTAVAAARAVGPATMGLFFGLGDRVGSDALGWWFVAAVAAVGAVQAFWVTDEGEEED